MIVARMRLFDIPFLDGNMFRQVTISCAHYFVISFLNVLYGMEWHPHLVSSLIVHMDCLMSPICSFVVHVCRCAGDKNYWSVSGLLSPW